MAQVAASFLSKPRNPSTKGAARRLRANGWVPAVAYGPSFEARHLAVDPKSFSQARREHGAACIYDVQVEGGESFKALIKLVDRNPVSREYLHIDLYAVDMNRPIKVEIKVNLVGKPKGLLAGAMLQQILRSVEVQCLPGDIPPAIEFDVSHLDAGDSVHLSELPFPPGVKATAVGDEAIAIMSIPDAEPTPAAAAAAEGAAAEGAAAEGEGEAKDKKDADKD